MRHRPIEAPSDAAWACREGTTRDRLSTSAESDGMRAGAWIVVGSILAGPATGQSSLFAQAIDFVRYAGPIIAYANQCMRDVERIERTVDAVVRFASALQTDDERLLIQSAMSIELVYHTDRPKAELCPDWLAKLAHVEEAVR